MKRYLPFYVLVSALFAAVMATVDPGDSSPMGLRVGGVVFGLFMCFIAGALWAMGED